MTPSLYHGRQPWHTPIPEAFQTTYNEVATRALITHEDKVLLVYEGHLDSWWLPGGRIKPGEPMLEGLAREIEEETALAVTLGDMVTFFDVIVPDRRRGCNKHIFHFVFRATPDVVPDFIERAHTDTDPDHPGKVSKMRWFTAAEIEATPNVFPPFLKDWAELLATRPKAYYGVKLEEGSPESFVLDSFRISTRAVAVTNNKLLMVTSDNWGHWCAPGGMVEYDEDVMTTATREVLEETGLKARSIAVVAVDEFFSPKHGHHGINLYTRCAVAEDTAPAEWCDPDNGKIVRPAFLSRQQLAALPRAYPVYMAELAWPQVVDNHPIHPVTPAQAGVHEEASSGYRPSPV